MQEILKTGICGKDLQIVNQTLYNLCLALCRILRAIVKITAFIPLARSRHSIIFFFFI